MESEKIRFASRVYTYYTICLSSDLILSSISTTIGNVDTNIYLSELFSFIKGWRYIMPCRGLAQGRHLQNSAGSFRQVLEMHLLLLLISQPGQIGGGGEILTILNILTISVIF